MFPLGETLVAVSSGGAHLLPGVLRGVASAGRRVLRAVVARPVARVA
jgi:hypothetical protein